MRKITRGIVASGAGLALALGTSLSAASVSSAAPSQNGIAHRKDNHTTPMSERQRDAKLKAMEKLSNGKANKKNAKGGGSTVNTGGTAVEFFDNNKQANVWTVLSEFSDVSHNEIPKPDRTMDNSTQWTADFNLKHYDDLFNNGTDSFKDYYVKQSSGKYTPSVTVEDWIKVGGTAASYGANNPDTGDDVNARGFITDTINAWWDAQKAQGKSDAELNAYLAQFDKWDRYDYDGDANFNEPDGYIDHFQAIHAGQGEEAGGGTLGEDAIWSHRWYVNPTGAGKTGPEGNLLGGSRVGGSKFFVGDYTVEPENGGLGVFVHEYGHDLGLPDFYDTAGGSNGTSFWTLMSAGSWLSRGVKDPNSFEYGIGSSAGDMGPEEKLFLGWLDPTVVKPGRTADVALAPVGDATTNEALQVLLPDRVTTTDLQVKPVEGSYAWYSNSQSDLASTLTRDVPAAQKVTIDASTYYFTEQDYDYWYVQYSTDGGTTWNTLGEYTGDQREWTQQTWTYNPAGAASKVRFLYKSDGGVNELGLLLDQIKTTVDGKVLDTDGAENTSGAWVSNGWTRTNGTVTTTSPRYYLMENRDYVNYDATLKTGPYNFGELATRPDWVQHFSYQNGMLVWLVDQGIADNNTSKHPGEGYALPVDAMPTALRWSNGSLVSNRIQPFDATFGIQKTDPVHLTRDVSDGNGGVTRLTLDVPARSMIPTFKDSSTTAYYDPANPQNSVKTVGSGVTATVKQQTDKRIKVHVVNPKAPKDQKKQ